MKKINFNRKTKGFTLAETLITLTILGVVAAITVPMLINKQMESANRTKLKKAMAAYEKAINQMIVDNDIKGSITAVEGFSLTDNCSGSRPYFKAIKEIAGNNCRFQTADKVWWDITDIEHPVISLKDQLTDAMVAGVKSNSADYKDDKTLFSMTGEITNGIVRINDLADTGLSTEDKANLDKIYAFINKDGSTSTPSSGGGTVGGDTSNQSEFMKKCTKNADSTYTCEGSTAKFYEQTFTEDCVIINDNNESCPVTTDKSTVVAIVDGDSSDGMSWNDAQNACSNGTHLAKAAEIQQLYNDGATGNLLDSICNANVNCKNSDYPFFWTSDEESEDDAFSFGSDDGFNSDGKDVNRYVICVGN